MPPAEPAKKTSSRTNGTTKQRSRKKGAAKKTARCHTCGARIRIPDGWTVGPAVRRHYWAKHRSVMQRASKSSR